MAQAEERQKCEVYSRVVGFLTPVSQWNKGKVEEFKDREEFDQPDSN
jgi:ribonucleoside-triphosphate reductase